VRVGTNTAPKASTLVSDAEPVHITASPEPFVSRAGRKLAAALETFRIDTDGVRAIDVGASTGGFTDCLLVSGASHVTAVDVGHGQMHWRIRNEPRVEVIERTNIRTADPSQFGEPFDLVVADLSFISLRTVASVLVDLGADDAEWLLLIKPQFEAGREGVGKGGIVRDVSVRHAAVSDVLDHFAGLGCACRGLIRSPITGATGNIEYVAWFRRGAESRTAEELIASAEDVTT
jgi:23S rRNA (cytidine1920-2'-O)/16S rRNA (cytidine1409-2'-O)-methyltransferase